MINLRAIFLLSCDLFKSCIFFFFCEISIRKRTQSISVVYILREPGQNYLFFLLVVYYGDEKRKRVKRGVKKGVEMSRKGLGRKQKEWKGFVHRHRNVF